MVMYNIPSRVIVNMPPELLAELARIDNIVGVKQANDEELGPIEGLAVLAGNDNTFSACSNSAAPGGILVASHVVGDQMREMWDAAQAGEIERAREIDAELTRCLRGSLGHHQPDTGQGGDRDARSRLGTNAAAACPCRRQAAGGCQSGAGGHRPSARPLTNFRE